MSAPPDIDTAMAWRGRTVRDQDGDELGTLSDLYLDSETSRPAWGGVKRGRLRKTETVVPLDDAREVDGDVYLPIERARFDEAPDVDPDVELTEEQERVLHEHYGREWTAPRAEGDDDASAPRSEGDDDASAPRSEGDDDASMIRSEEEVVVRKKPVQRVERVRLKKRIVTDEVKKTVPVRKEVITVERDPPGDGGTDDAEGGRGA